MDSIIKQLATQEPWEKFLAYRLKKGRFDWRKFNDADDFVANKSYIPTALELIRGMSLGVPRKITINKIGTDKKRVVYMFDKDKVEFLKLISYLLYKYDCCFAPNCFAFRRGIRVCEAIRSIHKSVKYKSMWAYKVDIQNYFNSISISILLPQLKKILADDVLLYDFFKRLLNDNRAEENGTIVYGLRGVMAGVPTAPFLANVYLHEMDHYFDQKGVIYARYSDDIIVFANDYNLLLEYISTIKIFLDKYNLRVNPTKERIYTPDEAYDFLGFKCYGEKIDISNIGIEKMKKRIRRKARSILRWKKRKNKSSEVAQIRLIKYFNGKFFECSGNRNILTWARWYLPVINCDEGLRKIDHYLQQYLRVLNTGRHTKSNYRTTYFDLKKIGYKSLVHEYYEYKNRPK